MNDWEAILRWYLVITLAAVAFYPLIGVAGAGLGPARAGLARPVGIVLLTAVVWWPAATLGLPFARWSLAIALCAAGSGLWVWWIRRGSFRIHLRVTALFELTWLLAFLGYVWFRSYYPDIVNTEKPMEIALLTSIVRSDEVPAPDPWLSGETINYYYFGYQVFASAIKLSGVEAAVGFNLALATVFASCVTAVAAAGTGLANGLEMRGRAVAGAAALSALLVVLAGNLETPRRLLSDARGTIEAGWWDGVGWQASRIIVDSNVHSAGDSRATINEFPAFSFVLGDLHPHVMTYPILAAVLALAIGIALARGRISYPALLTGGVLTGLLYASNSWDAPLGLMMIAGAIAIAQWSNWRRVAVDLGIVCIAAIVTVAPFLRHYTAPVGVPNSEIPEWLTSLPVVGALVNTLGVVYWRPSSTRELVIVHGLWIVCFAVFTAREFRRRPARLAWVRSNSYVVPVAALLLLGVSAGWAPALTLLGVPLTLAVWLVLRSHEVGSRTLAGVYTLGFTLVLIPEFFFLQDVFMDRMNTVFKLYFQGWLLLGMASGITLVDAVRAVRGWGGIALRGATAALVLAALTYTPLSAWDWTNGFDTRWGLDGSAYLARTAAGDSAGLEWIRQHAEDGDWLVEAPGCTYVVLEGAPMSRVSAFSGVPALIGWYGHEGQWRRGEERDIYGVLNARMITANAILDGDVGPTQDGPAFVVLGRQERYGAGRCDRVTERPVDVEERFLASGWIRGFTDGDIVIFVPPWRASGVTTR